MSSKHEHCSEQKVLQTVKALAVLLVSCSGDNDFINEVLMRLPTHVEAEINNRNIYKKDR